MSDPLPSRSAAVQIAVHPGSITDVAQDAPSPQSPGPDAADTRGRKGWRRSRPSLLSTSAGRSSGGAPVDIAQRPAEAAIPGIIPDGGVRPPRQTRPKLAKVPPAPARRPRAVKEDVLILSRRRGLYSTRRLVEAARARGRRARVVDALRCTVLIAPGGLQLITEGRVLKDATVVVPRIGASITRQGLAVLNQLAVKQIPVLNAPTSIARSRDKLLAMQLLAQAGLDVPRTAMAHPGADAESVVAAVGGLPVVVKLLKGTQGIGVMLASSMEEVRSYLGTFHELGEDVVLQEFVAESAGRDVRALVVGDRVVASMRRRAGGGDFRSNLHRGGTGERLSLPPAWEALALRAARAVGLEVAGVDMLEGRDGPRVMELNSSPGLEGIEAATAVDVAGAIIDHALDFAQRSGSLSQDASGDVISHRP